MNATCSLLRRRLATLGLLAASFTLASCAFVKDGQVAYFTLGGSGALEGSNGMRFTHSHDASFQVGAQVAGAAIAGGLALQGREADNALSTVQTLDAGKTARQGQALDAAQKALESKAGLSKEIISAGGVVPAPKL